MNRLLEKSNSKRDDPHTTILAIFVVLCLPCHQLSHKRRVDLPQQSFGRSRLGRSFQGHIRNPIRPIYITIPPYCSTLHHRTPNRGAIGRNNEAQNNTNKRKENRATKSIIHSKELSKMLLLSFMICLVLYGSFHTSRQPFHAAAQ
jgi:hypothetical protein